MTTTTNRAAWTPKPVFIFEPPAWFFIPKLDGTKALGDSFRKHLSQVNTKEVQHLRPERRATEFQPICSALILNKTTYEGIIEYLGGNPENLIFSEMQVDYFIHYFFRRLAPDRRVTSFLIRRGGQLCAVEAVHSKYHLTKAAVRIVTLESRREQYLKPELDPIIILPFRQSSETDP